MIRTAPTPTHMIDALIDQHGARAVLLRALRALFRAQPRPPDPHGLSDHLRRDVGLEPRNRPPGYWEHLR